MVIVVVVVATSVIIFVVILKRKRAKVGAIEPRKRPISRQSLNSSSSASLAAFTKKSSLNQTQLQELPKPLSPEESKTIKKYQSIWEAVYANNTTCIEIFLKRGEDIHQMDERG